MISYISKQWYHICNIQLHLVAFFFVFLLFYVATSPLLMDCWYTCIYIYIVTGMGAHERISFLLYHVYTCFMCIYIYICIVTDMGAHKRISFLLYHVYTCLNFQQYPEIRPSYLLKKVQKKDCSSLPMSDVSTQRFGHGQQIICNHGIVFVGYINVLMEEQFR